MGAYKLAEVVGKSEQLKFMKYLQIGKRKIAAAVVDNYGKGKAMMVIKTDDEGHLKIYNIIPKPVAGIIPSRKHEEVKMQNLVINGDVTSEDKDLGLAHITTKVVPVVDEFGEERDDIEIWTRLVGDKNPKLEGLQYVYTWKLRNDRELITEVRYGDIKLDERAPITWVWTLDDSEKMKAWAPNGDTIVQTSVLD